MPYVFGGLVLLNAATLGYYLFFQQPSISKTLQDVQESLIQPVEFTNSAEFIPPDIGSKD